MKKIFTLLLISCCYFSKAQQTDSTLFTKVDVEASFPGGEAAWNEYVRLEIEKNIRKIMRNKASVGTCEVQFIVDKEGRITSVEALTMKNSTLAKIVVESIQNGPRWVPAEQNGKKVKAWRRQKVTFRAPE